jgi:hypothetical protein
MRELMVRIRFTSHCLGNVRKHYREKGRLRNYYVLPRNPDDKVIFMPTWWASTMRRAAEILCKHHNEVRQIRFALEVDGNPRPIPDQLFRRYFESDKFSQHEAFYPGDVIGVTCVVPTAIDDDDFRRLMTIAGKYCGMSPGQPNKEFGYYVVESVTPTMPPQPMQRKQRSLGEDNEVGKREEPSNPAMVDGSSG